MALPDGRFLIASQRYQELLSNGLEQNKLAFDQFDQFDQSSTLTPVHPNFRVIALGLPIPEFVGFPLDPPLRSRFQVSIVL